MWSGTTPGRGAAVLMLSESGRNKRRILLAAPGTDRLLRGQEQRVGAYVSDAYVIRNRKKLRSRELLDAIRALDVTTDEQTRKELLDKIQAEYAERNGGTILGLFSKCYLGEPFVDHRLSIAETILEHYQRNDIVPEPFSSARILAQSSMYIYIEIYSDGSIVPIRSDGSGVI